MVASNRRMNSERPPVTLDDEVSDNAKPSGESLSLAASGTNIVLWDSACWSVLVQLIPASNAALRSDTENKSLVGCRA
jgi:hypothetical protein